MLKFKDYPFNINAWSEVLMSEENIEFLSFEDALQQLENLVRELEAGKVKLDDAVSAYERAVKLKNFCERKLNDARLKIEKIEVAPDGQMTLSPLDKATEDD